MAPSMLLPRMRPRRMRLPGGQGEIQININTQPNSFTIRISWSERNEMFDYTLATVI